MRLPQDNQDMLVLNRKVYAFGQQFTCFDYLTAAVTVIIFIIRIQQGHADTNDSTIVTKLRTKAGSYLQKSALKTIKTSDRGAGIRAITR